MKRIASVVMTTLLLLPSTIFPQGFLGTSGGGWSGNEPTLINAPTPMPATKSGINVQGRISIPNFWAPCGLDTAYCTVYPYRSSCIAGAPVGVAVYVEREMLPTYTGSGLQIMYSGDPSRTEVAVDTVVYRSKANQPIRVYANGRKVAEAPPSPANSLVGVQVILTLADFMQWMKWGKSAADGKMEPGRNVIEVESGDPSACTTMLYAAILVSQPQMGVLVHGMGSDCDGSFKGIDVAFRPYGNPVLCVNVTQPNIDDLRVAAMQEAMAMLPMKTGIFNSHFIMHSAGCPTFQGAYSRPYANFLMMPISVQCFAGATLGSVLSPYFMNRQITSNIGDLTEFGALGVLSKANADGIMFVLGRQPGVISDLDPEVRLPAYEQFLAARPMKRWVTIPNAPDITYDCYGFDANFEDKEVNISGEKKKGLPVTDDVGNAMYKVVGMYSTTRAKNYTFNPPGAKPIVLKVQVPIPRGDGLVMQNDLLIAKNGANPSGCEAHFGFHANHVSARELIQNAMALKIHQQDAVFFVLVLIAGN